VRADLSGANLSQVKFNGAYLTGVNLSDAILSGTDFCGADLSEIDLLVLKEAKASGAKLAGAKYNWVNFFLHIDRLKMPLQEYSSLLDILELSEDQSHLPCLNS
jgi:uncharacterized protein YjbI with pentapeptide repeats